MRKLREYRTLEEFYTLERIYYKGGKRILGNLTGGLIGESDAQRAQKRAMRQAEEEARLSREESRRQAEEETRRRTEERARAEEEARKRAEAEAKRQRDLEEKQRAEEQYRKQVAEDTMRMERDVEGYRQMARGGEGTPLGKPKTTVDFSKSLKVAEDEEDKLKKVFKR